MSGPQTFERVKRAQFAGCFAYILLLPTVTIVGALIPGLIASWIVNLAKVADKPWATAGALGVAALGGLGGAALVIREFYRRSGSRIVVHDDRLEVQFGGRADVYRFQDLEWISGPSLDYLSRLPVLTLNRSFVLALKRPGAQALQLRVEEWPVKDIAKVLLERAVPLQLDAMEARIAAGGVLEFRPSPLLALRYLILGTAALGLSAFLWFAWWQLIVAEKSFKAFGFPLFLAVVGCSALAMVPRARGGVWISRSGILKRKQGALIPWSKVTGLQVLPDAANIQLDDGSTVTMGMLSRNYDAGLALLRRQGKPGATPSGSP